MMQMHGKPNSHFYAYLDISVDIYQCTSPDEIQEFKMHRSASKIREKVGFKRFDRNPGSFIGKFFKISPRLRPNFHGLLTKILDFHPRGCFLFSRADSFPR